MASKQMKHRRVLWAARGREFDTTRLRKLTPWIGGGLMCFALPASAQYSLQMAEQYRTFTAPPSTMSPGPSDRGYNLKLGPTEWSFSAGLSIGWTSNAQMATSDTSSSFYMTPSASINMYMPIAERTSLTLALSMGYTFYLNDTDSNLNGFYLTPGSQLSYTMYIGDVQLSFYDSMGVSQFAFNDPTTGPDNPEARTFSNAFGMMASTTLYKTTVSGGFTQANSWQLGGTGGVGDTGSQNLTASAGYQVLPQLNTGLSGGLTWMHYNTGNQTIMDGGFQWNVGPTLSWTVTERLIVSGSFGYTVYTQNYLFGLPSTDSGSMYWSLAWSQPVTDWLSYSVSGGHTISPNYYAGPTDAYNASLGLSWSFIKDFSISTPFGYSNGVGLVPETAFGPGSERYQAFTTGVSFGYAFTKKLSSSFNYSYNYYMQDSGVGDYAVNTISIGFSYRF
jgi:hypothetical protein